MNLHEAFKEAFFFKTPFFWYEDRSVSSFLIRNLLRPISFVYHFIIWLKGFCSRWVERPYRASIPLICVGNIVAGGAGKTPTSIAIANYLTSQGVRVCFLLRGHGRMDMKPILKVDLAIHTHRQVGDEALLLAKHAGVIVAKNRKKAIQLIEKEMEVDIIIADDGLQNSSFHKDLSILVLNGPDGLGNGLLLPAGPLREPLDARRDQVDFVVMIGADKHGLKKSFTCPVIHGDYEVKAESKEGAKKLLALPGLKIGAFTGIARPIRFFKTCRALFGASLVSKTGFADHYDYGAGEIRDMLIKAQAKGLRLVTTEKDYVRIEDEFKPYILPILIDLVWKNPSLLTTLLSKCLRGSNDT